MSHAPRTLTRCRHMARHRDRVSHLATPPKHLPASNADREPSVYDSVKCTIQNILPARSNIVGKQICEPQDSPVAMQDLLALLRRKHRWWFNFAVCAPTHR